LSIGGLANGVKNIPSSDSAHQVPLSANKTQKTTMLTFSAKFCSINILEAQGYDQELGIPRISAHFRAFPRFPRVSARFHRHLGDYLGTSV